MNNILRAIMMARRHTTAPMHDLPPEFLKRAHAIQKKLDQVNARAQKAADLLRADATKLEQDLIDSDPSLKGHDVCIHLEQGQYHVHDAESGDETEVPKERAPRVQDEWVGQMLDKLMKGEEL